MVHDEKFGDDFKADKNRPPFYFDDKLDKAADRVKKILEKEEKEQNGSTQGQVCTA